jgi:hypothetical protein
VEWGEKRQGRNMTPEGGGYGVPDGSQPGGGGGKWPPAPGQTPVGGRVGAWRWEQEEQSTFSLLYFGSLQDGYIDLAE